MAIMSEIYCGKNLKYMDRPLAESTAKTSESWQGCKFEVKKCGWCNGYHVVPKMVLFIGEGKESKTGGSQSQRNTAAGQKRTKAGARSNAR